MNNIKNFYTKYYESAVFYYYTKENLRFDLIITSPHAEKGSDFINYDFPEIVGLVNVSKEDFYDFMSLEYDFGTQELSHAIAEYLYNEYDISTLVIEPTFPRSILDAGRLFPNCIRNIVDYEKYPEFKDRLMRLYDGYMELLCNAVAFAKTYGALSIDLHTMSSYSPNVIQERYAEAIVESPDNILEYITLYKRSHIEGEKRVTELFTGDSRNGIFASKELLVSLSSGLQRRNVVVDYDKPYILAEHLVAHYLVCELSTVCIDLPKDLLSSKTTEDDDYDITKLTIDPRKLSIMAKIFSMAVRKALNKIERNKKKDVKYEKNN